MFLDLFPFTQRLAAPPTGVRNVAGPFILGCSGAAVKNVSRPIWRSAVPTLLKNVARPIPRPAQASSFRHRTWRSAGLPILPVSSRPGKPEKCSWTYSPSAVPTLLKECCWTYFRVPPGPPGLRSSELGVQLIADLTPQSAHIPRVKPQKCSWAHFSSCGAWLRSRLV